MSVHLVMRSGVIDSVWATWTMARERAGELNIIRDADEDYAHVVTMPLYSSFDDIDRSDMEGAVGSDNA